MAIASSSYRCCAIVPVYNHHLKIAQVVRSLVAHGLEVLLINDGSSKDCSDVLLELDRASASVHYFGFSENQGKGAAVCFAIRKALELGFSHALQVDADGQHDLDDVPKFLALSQQEPAQIISGSRIYSSVPKNRRYGRLLTDVWVWINTLSFSIKDSMCGYRLYPLSATVAVLERFNIGQRMDFDTDLIVKCYWQGMDVDHVDTAILYSDEIPSHFDLLADNVRITKMHTRLFFGMLRRFPRLVLRHFA